MTILFLSQTFASLPNSRLNTPMVPGPHTSCVISTSAFTQILSPAWTVFLPEARARSFSVNVIMDYQDTRWAGQVQLSLFRGSVLIRLRSAGFSPLHREF